MFGGGVDMSLFFIPVYKPLISGILIFRPVCTGNIKYYTGKTV